MQNIEDSTIAQTEELKLKTPQLLEKWSNTGFQV